MEKKNNESTGRSVSDGNFYELLPRYQFSFIKYIRYIDFNMSAVTYHTSMAHLVKKKNV